QLRAFTAADPVALHGANFFRPALQFVQITQQLLRILCDSQEPLLEFALLDNSVFVTPATAGNYLLICQYGGALRTPVHLALLTVGKSALVKLQKEPLIPPVVFRQASCNFARPVVGETQALHLRLHFRNVAKGPLAWRVWFEIAAFSAGNPNESQPMG